MHLYSADEVKRRADLINSLGKTSPAAREKRAAWAKLDGTPRAAYYGEELRLYRQLVVWAHAKDVGRPDEYLVVAKELHELMVYEHDRDIVTVSVWNALYEIPYQMRLWGVIQLLATYMVELKNQEHGHSLAETTNGKEWALVSVTEKDLVQFLQYAEKNAMSQDLYCRACGADFTTPVRLRGHFNGKDAARCAQQPESQWLKRVVDELTSK